MGDIKKYAIIVAGGKGERMGSALPKQFLPVLGKPLLYYTIKAFTEAIPHIHIILVLPADQMDYAGQVLAHFTEKIDVVLKEGGKTRFHSVQNGLKDIRGNAVIFIHDGVRPLVSKELIKKCYQQTLDKGSAIPVVAVADSIRLIDGPNNMPLSREQLRAVQTPQTFRSAIILPAYQQEYQARFTDEATVAEAAGTKVYLIEGERSNIKVTTPDDLVIAEALLKARLQHA